MCWSANKGTSHKWGGLNNGNKCVTSALEVGSQRWSCLLRVEAGSEVDLALGLWKSIIVISVRTSMGSRAHPNTQADIVTSVKTSDTEVLETKT